MRIAFITATLLILGSYSLDASESLENEIKGNISVAKKYMHAALTKKNPILSSLSNNQILLIKRYKDAFLDELSSMNINIQASEDQPFIHFNKETWIETDVRQYGEIRIRNLEKIKKSFNYGPQFFIHFLGHEIGHHLLSSMEGDMTPEIESLAWQISSTFEKFIVSQSIVPQLFQLPIGKYLSSKEGCHDHAEIKEVDPFKGVIKMNFTTSTDHCRIYNKYFEWYYHTHNVLEFLGIKKALGRHFIYDNIAITFQCKKMSNKLFCIDIKPSRLFDICPDYLLMNRGKINDGLASSLQIQDGSILHSNLGWCVSDSVDLVGIHTESKIYSVNSTPMPLSQTERERNSSLNDSMLDLTFITKKEMFEFQAVDLIEAN